MWFLLIVLLAPPPGIDRVTVLNTFVTYEDCQPERNRIGFEMAESYPYDNDFRIVCEFRGTKPFLQPAHHEEPKVRSPFAVIPGIHSVLTRLDFVRAQISRFPTKSTCGIMTIVCTSPSSSRRSTKPV